MSRAAFCVRHQRRQIDGAIGRGYGRLAQDTCARSRFAALLQLVRQRGRGILCAPVCGGRHLGIEALVNLARFQDFHVRRAECWPGADATWRWAVHSLGQHLIGRYPVPVFLSAAWYATDEALGEHKRRWLVAHAGGASFRSLDLPVHFTRRMEHLFLASADHLPIEHAIRRAELLGLGAESRLVDTVLSSRAATDLTHGAFWRTVWLFLIAHANEIPHHLVGPLLDFIQGIRHDRTAVETPAGVTIVEPPQPNFSMKGRTPRSMVRLMDDWHRDLGRRTGGLSWTRSRWCSLHLQVPSPQPDRPPVQWEIVELTDAEQLRAEGAALRHCVATYSYRCWNGSSRIWSLRRRTGSRARPVLTIEVDVRKRHIVQARGFRNRPASARLLELVRFWASRERLRLVL